MAKKKKKVDLDPRRSWNSVKTPATEAYGPPMGIISVYRAVHIDTFMGNDPATIRSAIEAIRRKIVEESHKKGEHPESTPRLSL